MVWWEKVVFSGKLDFLSWKQAQDLVPALGGKSQTAFTKGTTILMIGTANTTLFQEDPRSLKMQKIEAYSKKDGRFACYRIKPSWIMYLLYTWIRLWSWFKWVRNSVNRPASWVSDYPMIVCYESNESVGFFLAIGLI